MSNPDSFIQEVNEEVRRDRFFLLLKRYGWIAAVVIAVIVGGAAYLEWQKSQSRAAAEGFGDAILAALNSPEDSERATTLAAVAPSTEGQEMILSLIQAAEAAGREDTVAAVNAWIDIANRPNVPELYQHLALLKAHLAGGTGDAEADAQALERLATPGAPFRPLAMEQQALVLLKSGETQAASAQDADSLRDAAEAPGATDILRQRTSQLIVALGGTLDPA